jgi:hypothetical protein
MFMMGRITGFTQLAITIVNQMSNDNEANGNSQK